MQYNKKMYHKDKIILKDVRIILHNINANKIQSCTKSCEEPKKQIDKKSSSCINISSKNSANNLQLLQKYNSKTDATKNKRCTSTGNILKNNNKCIKKKDKYMIEVQLNQNVKLDKDRSDDCASNRIVQSEIIEQKKQLSSHDSAPISDNEKDHQSSIKRSVPETTVLVNINKGILNSSKSDDAKLDAVNSNNTNCLNKKDLTFIGHNSKIVQAPNQTIKEGNNDSCSVNITNETDCILKQKESQTKKKCKRSQNKKNLICSTPKTNQITEIVSNKSKICDKQNISVMEPTIILPKVMEDTLTSNRIIKIVNANNINISLQTDICQRTSSIKNRHKDSDKNTKQKEAKKQISRIDNTLKSTNIILRKKEDDERSDINKSIDISDTSKYILSCNNNILKNKNILNNELGIHKTSNSSNPCFLIKSEDNVCNNVNMNNDNVKHVAVPNEDCPTNRDIQSNNSSNNDKEFVQQNLKRTAEKNNNNVSTNNKRIKLNRKFLMQDGSTRLRSVNLKSNQQSNDLGSTDAIVTTESNVASKDVEFNEKHDEKIDLRQSDNTDNLSSKQENLDNKIDTVSANPIENKIIYDKTSIKKTLILNEVLCENKSSTGTTLSHNTDLHLFQKSQSTLEEIPHEDNIDMNMCEDVQDVQENMNDNELGNENDNDDCISLFAEDLFNISQNEDTFLHENKSCTSTKLDQDTSYMSCQNFNKYVEQNKNEFNAMYECIENSEKELHQSKERKEIFNKEPKQTLQTNHHVSNMEISKSTKSMVSTIEYTSINDQEINQYFLGFCYEHLKRGKCKRRYYAMCPYRHDTNKILHIFHWKDPSFLMKIIQYTLNKKYYLLCQKIYIESLIKLNIEQIFTIYKMLSEVGILGIERIPKIIEELLRKRYSLKIIAYNMIMYILPVQNSTYIKNILLYVEKYIKPGEYWDIVKDIIVLLKPEKDIIEKILYDCLNNEKLYNIQDINDTLISKLQPTVLSSLDKDLMERFKQLLIENTNSCSAESSQNFEESLTIETIDSPNSPEDSSRMDSLQKCDVTFRNGTCKLKNKIRRSRCREGKTMNNITYKLQHIDGIPEARSSFRNHNNLWKFYVDLYRLQQGLEHEDYDYVISIFKNYTKKEDNLLFSRSCCRILQTEIERSNHLENIVRRRGNEYFKIKAIMNALL